MRNAFAIRALRRGDGGEEEIMPSNIVRRRSIGCSSIWGCEGWEEGVLDIECAAPIAVLHREGVENAKGEEEMVVLLLPIIKGALLLIDDGRGGGRRVGDFGLGGEADRRPLLLFALAADRGDCC